MSRAPSSRSVATPKQPRLAPATNRPADIRAALLTIVEHHVGRRAVLSAIGEVDVSTAADLRAAIDRAAARAFEIWIDLTQTTFMDSTGLHTLTEAASRLADSNLRLSVICPEGSVLRVLRLTRLDRILEIHATRSDANYAAGT
jgi:anti-anti-sigma factor